MKNNKPNAALLWKQPDEDIVPRLGLNVAERIVYAFLLRNSRLEGKRQFRFGIIWLAGCLRLSQSTTRHTVRSLAAKGALRLIDRTQLGHLAEIFLPDEIRAATHEEPLPSCLGREPGGLRHRGDGFLAGEQPARGHSCARARPVLLLSAALLHSWARLDHVVPQARGGTNSYRNLVSCCVECNSQRAKAAPRISSAPSIASAA